MSDPSKKSLGSPVPWILPASRRGVPTGYRAIVTVGCLAGMVALPFGFWTFLLGLAFIAALAHQGVIDRRAAQKREEVRQWHEDNPEPPGGTSQSSGPGSN